jgi:protein-disulfide isomerase/uncharacterized membrane protein
MARKYWWWSCVLLVIGFSASLYSLYHHFMLQSFGVTEALCNINSLVSCDQVARSDFSSWWGVPLGVWGCAYFMTSLLLLIGARKASFYNNYMQLYYVTTIVGFVVALSLAVISIGILGSLCLVCFVVYVAIAGQLAFVAGKYKEIFSNFLIKDFIKFSLVPLSSLALVFGIYFSDSSEVKESLLEQTPRTQGKPYDIPVELSAFSQKGQDYYAGSKKAILTIVEFADFECPACKDASKELLKVKEEFKDKVLVVFKNYPLDNSCNHYISSEFHQNSCDFAKLARCAGRLDLFWQYHNLAFSAQKSKRSPAEVAQDVGLTKEDIEICLQDKNILQKIKDDIELANSLGIKGTPAIYLNGHLYEGNRALLKHEVARILNL